MHVISRNYFNRDDSAKWLVREPTTPARLAAAVGAVLALNVIFVSSNSFESGFGCSVVAVADEADWASGGWDHQHFKGIVPRDAERITFDGHVFRDPDQSTVLACDKLFLLPDGGMWAVGVQTDKNTAIAQGGLNKYGAYATWTGPRPSDDADSGGLITNHRRAA